MATGRSERESKGRRGREAEARPAAEEEWNENHTEERTPYSEQEFGVSRRDAR